MHVGGLNGDERTKFVRCLKDQLREKPRIDEPVVRVDEHPATACPVAPAGNAKSVFQIRLGTRIARLRARRKDLDARGRQLAETGVCPVRRLSSHVPIRAGFPFPLFSRPRCRTTLYPQATGRANESNLVYAIDSWAGLFNDRQFLVLSVLSVVCWREPPLRPHYRLARDRSGSLDPLKDAKHLLAQSLLLHIPPDRLRVEAGAAGRARCGATLDRPCAGSSFDGAGPSTTVTSMAPGMVENEACFSPTAAGSQRDVTSGISTLQAGLDSASSATSRTPPEGDSRTARGGGPSPVSWTGWGLGGFLLHLLLFQANCS